MEKRIELEKADTESLRGYFAAFDKAQQDLAVAATVVMRRMGIDPSTARVDGFDEEGKLIVHVPDTKPHKAAAGGTAVIPPKGGRKKR